MDMSTHIQEILSAIRTKEDRNLLFSALEDLENRLYKINSAKEQSVAHTLPERIERPLWNILRSRELADKTPAVREFFGDLRNALKRMRILKLEIAFDPTDEAIASVSDWLNREVAKDIIIEWDVDRALLGGAKMIFEGKYSAWTLGDMIERDLGTKREEILKKFAA